MSNYWDGWGNWTHRWRHRGFFKRTLFRFYSASPSLKMMAWLEWMFFFHFLDLSWQKWLNLGECLSAQCLQTLKWKWLHVFADDTSVFHSGVTGRSGVLTFHRVLFIAQTEPLTNTSGAPNLLKFISYWIWKHLKFFQLALQVHFFHHLLLRINSMNLSKAGNCWL